MSRNAHRNRAKRRTKERRSYGKEKGKARIRTTAQSLFKDDKERE